MIKKGISNLSASNHIRSIHHGYFTDDQIKARMLSDWEGQWQSVYPYLLAGKLDPILRYKTKYNTMTIEESYAYYQTAYKTNVTYITITGNEVSFYQQNDQENEIITACYHEDNYEILTYAKGNRGVRFIFKKISGNTKAPQFLQFSDHNIAPIRSDHFHLFSGNDRAALLQELTNWPTYYLANLSTDDIIEKMKSH